MSDLKYLKRQYHNAKGRAQVARSEEAAALTRLQDALVAERMAILAADGIMIGSVVDAFEKSYLGRPEAHLGRFVVLDVRTRFWFSTSLEDAMAILGKLKKDDSPGKQPTNVPWRYGRLALVEMAK